MERARRLARTAGLLLLLVAGGPGCHGRTIIEDVAEAAITRANSHTHRHRHVLLTVKGKEGAVTSRAVGWHEHRHWKRKPHVPDPKYHFHYDSDIDDGMTVVLTHGHQHGHPSEGGGGAQQHAHPHQHRFKGARNFRSSTLRHAQVDHSHDNESKARPRTKKRQGVWSSR